MSLSEIIPSNPIGLRNLAWSKHTQILERGGNPKTVEPLARKIIEKAEELRGHPRFEQSGRILDEVVEICNSTINLCQARASA